ncbi:MAG TPA: hypothetical protein VGK33_05365 [Chloroflexota bacterium]|jgi:hypothetical protein
MVRLNFGHRASLGPSASTCKGKPSRGSDQRVAFFPNSLDYLMSLLPSGVWDTTVSKCVFIIADVPIVPLSYVVGPGVARVGNVRVLAGYLAVSAAVNFALIFVFWHVLAR